MTTKKMTVKKNTSKLTLEYKKLKMKDSTHMMNDNYFNL